LSCRGRFSCLFAQLSGVDLINSCNKKDSCAFSNGNDEVTGLIDCCNDEEEQCQDKEGLDIVNAGCVSYV